MLETLDKWDKWLFYQLNGVLTNSFFDAWMPIWRDQYTWLPVYLFVALMVFYNFGWKVWPWVVALIATAALTDQVSSGFMKPFFGRIRPCNNPDLSATIRLLIPHCSGGFSFTSSHASNHFGAAAFLFFTLRQHQREWAWIWWGWAATISYGQVYVGVHYPGDVAAGMLLGLLTGTLMARMFNIYLQWPAMRHHQIITPLPQDDAEVVENAEPDSGKLPPYSSS